MKPSEVQVALAHLTKQQRPIFLWGAPGVGKSDVVRQTAADLGYELRDKRLSTMDPTMMQGDRYGTGTVQPRFEQPVEYSTHTHTHTNQPTNPSTNLCLSTGSDWRKISSNLLSRSDPKEPLAASIPLLFPTWVDS